MEPTQDRSRHGPGVRWEAMAAERERREARWGLRKALAQAAMGSRPVVVDLPDAEYPPQMVFPEWDQVIEALAVALTPGGTISPGCGVV